MRLISAVILILLLARPACPHPHSGGIVVRPDGKLLVGDILGARLLVIGLDGAWREIPGVGDIRGLSKSTDGTVYRVNWQRGAGVWRLRDDFRPVPVLRDFNGFMAPIDQGSMLLSPIGASDSGQTLEIVSADGTRSKIGEFTDITALTTHQGTGYFAAGLAVHAIDSNGATRTLAADVGHRVYGLAVGSEGLIVALYRERKVVELTADGTRRVLLVSEPPWGPTDVAMKDGTLYVVELAEHPCCWKGPRVRRVDPGQNVVTLLIFDDGDHLHLSPGERPLQWMLGAVIVMFTICVASVVRFRRRRLRFALHRTAH